VGVVLYNNGNIPVIFPKGSRVAQLTFPVVVQLNKKSIVEVDHIEESARGVAGFGSTGV
jgi:dUTPase